MAFKQEIKQRYVHASRIRPYNPEPAPTPASRIRPRRQVNLEG